MSIWARASGRSVGSGAFDAALAGVVLVLTLSIAAPYDGRGLDALGILLAALASLPLVVRRHAPLAAFALTAAAGAALVALGYLDQAPGPLVALYFLTVSSEPAGARGLLAGAVVAGLFIAQVVAFGVVQDKGYSEVPPPFTALFWACAWVLGNQIRQRRKRVAELEKRAPQPEHATTQENT